MNPSQGGSPSTVRAAPLRPVLSALWRLLPAGERHAVMALVGVMVMAGACELGALVALKGFLGRVAPGVEPEGWGRSVAWVALAAVGVAATRLAMLKLQDRIVLGFAAHSSSEIFSRAMRQTHARHAARDSAELFAALESSQRLVNGALGPLGQSLVNGALAATLLAYLLVQAPLVVAALLVLWAAIHSFVGAVRSRPRSIPGPSLQVLASRRLKIAHEAQGGFRDVALAHAQQSVIDQFRATEAAYRARQTADRFAALAPRHVVEMGVMLVAVALVAWLSSRPDGLAASLPVLGVGALGMQRLMPMINGCHAGWRLFQANGDVLVDTLRLMQRPAEAVPQGNVEPLPFEHSLSLEAVSVRHEGRPALLDGVTLTIRKGERVGFIGASGSGKSSLLDVLLGLAVPTQGTVRVDGVALDTPERAWGWQRQLSFVAQTVYLPDATIRQVVTGLAPAAKDGRFDDAVRRAGLSDFVASLAEGADTRIGDGGVLLSGGQRQRVAIARALYRQAPVIVLDEATSQLDAETEAGVLGALRALGRSVTLLVVTHRPATLGACDRVFEVGGGAVAERRWEVAS